MPWLKVLRSGIVGDEKKMWAKRLNCPYLLCPSNQPFEGARPSRMKFIEKIQPYVYKYKCRYCGFYIHYGADGPKIPHLEKPHIMNPNFLHRKD